MSQVSPQRITTAEYKTYSAAWKKLINGPDASTLSSSFLAESGLINYVYLPVDMADALLTATPAPTSIALVFALIPTDTTPAFTMLLAGLDGDNSPQEPYYQAGVAGRAALVVQPFNGESPIPYNEAKDWINRWNNLNPEGLGPLQFEAGGDEYLVAYDYENADLEGAMHSEAPPADAALWFNFVLHEDTPLFGTVLTLNARPSATDPGTIIVSSELSYFDVSKPSPPFHIAELTAQQ